MRVSIDTKRRNFCQATLGLLNSAMSGQIAEIMTCCNCAAAADLIQTQVIVSDAATPKWALLPRPSRIAKLYRPAGHVRLSRSALDCLDAETDTVRT